MLSRIKTFIKSYNFRIFLIFLAICFAAYVGYLNRTAIGDNYCGRMSEIDQQSFGEFFNSSTVAVNGRHMTIVYWLIHAPLSKLGFTYFQNQWIFFAIEIIVLAIASTIFYKIFSRLLKVNKISLPLIIATAIIAVNPFICDTLVYLIPSHPQALLLTALALYYFTKGSGRKNMLLTLLFLTMSVSTYQSYYAVFIILALPYIFIENKGKIDKKFFKRIGAALLITALSVVAVMLISKLHCALIDSANAKSTSLNLAPSWIFNRLSYAFRTFIVHVSSGYFIFPPLLISLLFGFTVIAISVSLIRKHKIKELIAIVLILVFGFFSPIYYSIVADSFYLAPRVVTAVFASIGICIICLMYYFPKLQVNNIFKGGLVILMSISVYCCSSVITDIQIANHIELAELRVIDSRIKAYEAERGITVDTVKVRHGGHNAVDTFDKQNINLSGTTNASRNLATVDWSDVGSLDIVAGRKFIREDMTDEEYNSYFSNIKAADFEYFDPDVRLKFIDNTLYWVYY